jgi:hypothetical protein
MVKEPKEDHVNPSQKKSSIGWVLILINNHRRILGGLGRVNVHLNVIIPHQMLQYIVYL